MSSLSLLLWGTLTPAPPTLESPSNMTRSGCHVMLSRDYADEAYRWVPPYLDMLKLKLAFIRSKFSKSHSYLSCVNRKNFTLYVFFEWSGTTCIRFVTTEMRARTTAPSLVEHWLWARTLCFRNNFWEMIPSQKIEGITNGTFSGIAVPWRSCFWSRCPRNKGMCQWTSHWVVFLGRARL